MEVAVEVKVFALAMRVVCCWYFDDPNIGDQELVHLPGVVSVCLSHPPCSSTSQSLLLIRLLGVVME